MFLVFAFWWQIPDQFNHSPTNVMIIQEIKPNYVIAKDKHQSYIVYGLSDVGLDDEIKVEGKCKEIVSVHNFYGFSFQDWCEHRNIKYQWQVSSFQIINQGTTIRHHLYERMKGLKQHDFVESVLYGSIEQKDTLGSMFQASGFIVASFFKTLRKYTKRLFPRYKSDLIAYGIGFFLVSQCAASAAIKRVLVFETVRVLPFHNVKDRFAFSCLMCIFLFPYQLYEYGFWLACTIRFLYLFAEGRYLGKWLPLAVIIPFQLFQFYECNLLQVCLFSIYRVIFSYAYLYAWLIVGFPFLDQGVSFFMWIQQLPIISFLIITGKPYWIWILLWIRQVYQIYQGKTYAFIKLLFLLPFVSFQSFFNPFGEIMMVDIGQGDCFLITLPFHQGSMLIDVAGSLYQDLPKQVLLPILKAKGIQRIDLVVLTHDDHDHSGGIESLKKLIPVKQIITNYQPTLSFGNVEYSMLQDHSDAIEENDRSLLLYGTFGKHHYLFMGDASTKIESQLMKQYQLDVDVLKVSHHGSNTATSAAFIQSIKPQLALISVGKNNRYHHPHPETLAHLNTYHVTSQISAIDGAVSLYYTPWFTLFVNSVHQFGFLK